MSTNHHLTFLCIPVHPIMNVSVYDQAFSRAKKGFQWAKKGSNGDENLKISWNRVHIRIQHPKVSIKRYMMRHIKKVDFRARKWLSVKIWPLFFFFVKIDFFHFIFANWVIWNKKKIKIFFDRIRDFFEYASSSNTAKCPKSRFWEFSRTCGLFQRLEDV